MDSWLSIIASGAVSGIGAFLAIRIEIAVLRQRMNRSDEDRKEYREELREQLRTITERTDYAHERIDALTRSRMDTL